MFIKIIIWVFANVVGKLKIDVLVCFSVLLILDINKILLKFMRRSMQWVKN